MKTKLIDFGVLIHVEFISGHSDTKGVVGQYSTISFFKRFVWNLFNPVGVFAEI